MYELVYIHTLLEYSYLPVALPKKEPEVVEEKKPEPKVERKPSMEPPVFTEVYQDTVSTTPLYQHAPSTTSNHSCIYILYVVNAMLLQ